MIRTNENVELGNLVRIIKHEVKNKLTSTKSFIDLLIDDWDKEIKPHIINLETINKETMEDYETMLTTAKTSIAIQENLIETILTPETFLKMNQTENYDIEEKIKILVKENNLEYNENRNLNLYISKETKPSINTSTLTNMLLNNLVGNAIKYGNSDLNITVVTDLEKRIVKYDINTKEAIPKDKQSKIFKYERVHDIEKNPSIRGNGIGLSESKKIAESLGGNIYFESNETNGTTFTLELKYTPKANEDQYELFEFENSFQ